MVLESLLKGEKAEKHLLYVFFLGIVYCTVGILFDLWVFDGRIENVSLFITVFAAIPLMHKIISLEEKKTRKARREKSLLKEHEKALKAFIMLFFGIFVAFSFWFLVLPDSVGEKIFDSQLEDIEIIKNEVTGRLTDNGIFSSIFSHNLKVLLFSFLFSFFFGAGAIFILTWNASILAVALGSYVKESLSAAAGYGSNAFVIFVGTLTYGFFGYMTHGIFEIASYFVGGLAGGIISVAVIRHDLFNKNFHRIVRDAMWLLVVSISLLVLGAVIEVYFSTVFF